MCTFLCGLPQYGLPYKSAALAIGTFLKPLPDSRAIVAHKSLTSPVYRHSLRPLPDLSHMCALTSLLFTPRIGTFLEPLPGLACIPKVSGAPPCLNSSNISAGTLQVALPLRLCNTEAASMDAGSKLCILISFFDRTLAVSLASFLSKLLDSPGDPTLSGFPNFSRSPSYLSSQVFQAPQVIQALQRLQNLRRSNCWKTLKTCELSNICKSLQFSRFPLTPGNLRASSLELFRASKSTAKRSPSFCSNICTVSG